MPNVIYNIRISYINITANKFHTIINRINIKTTDFIILGSTCDQKISGSLTGKLSRRLAIQTPSDERNYERNGIWTGHLQDFRVDPTARALDSTSRLPAHHYGWRPSSCTTPLEAAACSPEAEAQLCDNKGLNSTSTRALAMLYVL